MQKYYIKSNVASTKHYYWNALKQNYVTDHTQATIFDNLTEAWKQQEKANLVDFGEAIVWPVRNA